MSQVILKTNQLTDPLEIIINGCRENDLQCQEQLYRFCYPEMIKICYRYAGDMDGAGIIYNNAMLRVFRSIQTYQHEGKLPGWVKSIVINCSLDFIKKQIRFKEEPIKVLHEEKISVAEEIFSKISVKDIQTLIFQLPKATATAFNLFIYEGCTHKQISKLLGISEGTSKWHVSEGRKLLKEKLENYLT